MKVPDSEWEYHPKEFGREVDNKVEIHTGLFGVALLVVIVLTSILIVILWSPFVLLGVGEVVTKAPTQWRCRWRRR